jgi:hypothetical protein
LNLLWLSSSQADLQVGRGGRLNHPNLLPQIRPTIPGYEASVSERLGILAARHLPVLEWSRHVQSRYFDNADLQRWTLDHPYLNPLHQITTSTRCIRSLPDCLRQKTEIEGEPSPGPRRDGPSRDYRGWSSKPPFNGGDSSAWSLPFRSVGTRYSFSSDP